ASVSAVFLLGHVSTDVVAARIGGEKRLSGDPADADPSCRLMAGRLEHDILFNFAASPVGAGLKRLYEYAKWFDAHGGARFIIHPGCESRVRDFRRND